MKKRMPKLTASVKNFSSKIQNAVIRNTSGESYVDSAVKILIAVVIGALLLAGLYALFNDTVMPTLTRRIQEMFNYAG